MQELRISSFGQPDTGNMVHVLRFPVIKTGKITGDFHESF